MTELLSLPGLPAGIRLLTDDEADRLRAMHPTLPASPEDCVTCEGRGTLRWWDGAQYGHDYDHFFIVQRGEVAEFKCSCDEQWIANRLFLHSGIGIWYQRLSWMDMDVAAEPGAVEKVATYLRNANAYMHAGCGLILHGGKGTGKTLLAVLALKHLLSIGYDGYLTAFSELIDTFMAGWRDPAEKRWFHRRIKNAGVLVIDDVGREFKQRRVVKGEGVKDYQTASSEASFDEVLRHRLAHALPTILTTNHSIEELREGYGGNILSLLSERSTTYRFTGEDWRERARYRLDEEIAQGLTRPIVIG